MELFGIVFPKNSLIHRGFNLFLMWCASIKSVSSMSSSSITRTAAASYNLIGASRKTCCSFQGFIKIKINSISLGIGFWIRYLQYLTVSYSNTQQHRWWHIFTKRFALIGMDRNSGSRMKITKTRSWDIGMWISCCFWPYPWIMWDQLERGQKLGAPNIQRFSILFPSADWKKSMPIPASLSVLDNFGISYNFWYIDHIVTIINRQIWLVNHRYHKTSLYILQYSPYTLRCDQTWLKSALAMEEKLLEKKHHQRLNPMKTY